MADDEVLECDHCGYESRGGDEAWFHTLPKRGWGTGPQAEEDLTVCGFCYRSQFVSSWAVGLNRGEAGDLAVELLAGLNLLREELKR